ncbi:hypothetical protein [Micromonospora sp. NPDC047740]|uniref:hypothetical protein n=1 Tax=Micromonospora sp. NPDC047740 TaxID=3364254 RepID=UPI00371B6A1B
MGAGRGRIEDMLQDAVQAAYMRERELFVERAHERSIVFHIARHLAGTIEAALPEWSVDVDYDRWHPQHIDGVKKRLRRRRVALAAQVSEQQPATAGQRDTAAALDSNDEEHDVYPDIIVHRRSGLSADDDLLVVEVKKEENGGHEDDREKLRAFMASPFYYQHAVFIILPRDGGFPRWEWIAAS